MPHIYYEKCWIFSIPWVALEVPPRAAVVGKVTRRREATLQHPMMNLSGGCRVVPATAERCAWPIFIRYQIRTRDDTRKEKQISQTSGTLYWKKREKKEWNLYNGLCLLPRNLNQVAFLSRANELCKFLSPLVPYLSFAWHEAQHVAVWVRCECR